MGRMTKQGCRSVVLVLLALALALAPCGLAGPLLVFAAGPTELAAPTSAQGIGALGRIEPRSRILRVSHDAGPEGARIGELRVEEGQSVKAGDVLAVFTSHPRREAELAVARAEHELLKARRPSVRAELEDARKDAERKESLAKTAAVSVTAAEAATLRLEKARSAIAALEAEIRGAEAQVRLKEEEYLQASVLAPIGGTVIKIYARPGERVTDQGVLEIADLSALDVVAQVYENDMPRIAVGQKAEIRLPGLAKVYQAEVRELGFQVRKNTVNDTDPLADRDNRVIEVRLTLEGDAVTDLRHQLYRQVQVHIVAAAPSAP